MNKFNHNEMLLFSKVTNLEQAESIRKIRNKCRKYMTRTTTFITKENQKKWFKKSNELYTAYLVGAIIESVVYIEVGYGLIKNNGNEFLLTGALVEEYRGKGHGIEIFKFLIMKCKEIDERKLIKLEVLNENLIAKNLYKKIGFKETHKNKIFTTMILEKE